MIDNVPLTDLFIVTDVLIFEIMRDCLVGFSTWLLIVCQSIYVYIICIMTADYHNKLHSIDFESSFLVTNSSFSAILEPHVIIKCIQAAVLEVELDHRVKSSILVTNSSFSSILEPQIIVKVIQC